jgi:hypothetical protein
LKSAGRVGAGMRISIGKLEQKDDRNVLQVNGQRQ